jgi:hypothetical protein
MTSPSSTPKTPDGDAARHLDLIRRTVARRSFCVLATSSPQNRPHAVGILYAVVDLTFYFLVGEDTVKVRNIRENSRVASSVPVRRFPFGPPMAVQFQGEAEILPVDDPQMAALHAQKKLRRITGLGALDHPGICYLAVTPNKRISSYGIGVPLWRLMRDVSVGMRSVELPT